jgi:hypothetical protein
MVKQFIKNFRSPDAEDYSQIVIEQITIASSETSEVNFSPNQRENTHEKVSWLAVYCDFHYNFEFFQIGKVINSNSSATTITFVLKHSKQKFIRSTDSRFYNTKATSATFINLDSRLK